MNREAKWQEARDAELSVVGAVFIENSVLDRVGSIVHPADFWDQRLGLMYEGARGMAARGEPIDPITLVSEAERVGSLEDIGGAEFILHVAVAASNTVNVEHYAKIVAETAAVRRAVDRLGALQQTAKSGSFETVEAFFDLVQAEALDMAPERDSSHVSQLKDELRPALEEIQRAFNNKTTVVGLPSGLDELDELTTGFNKGNLIILAARPSMGKTALALQAACAIARTGVSVNLHELEMPTAQLVRRIISQEARVPGQGLKTGHVAEGDLDRVFRALEVMSEYPIVINDKPGQTLMDIRAMARQTQMDKRTPPLGAIVVDYIQIMGVVKNSGNRGQDLGAISMGLKNLAKEMNVPVILLSQLNRSLESRPNKRPIMSDLRESGALEQDADDILFLYRDEVYNPETEDAGIAEIIAAKVRDGTTGTVKVGWTGGCTLFTNLGPRY